MKKLQLVLSLVIAIIVASFVFAGFAALGLVVVGISFTLLGCAAIYRSWALYQQRRHYRDLVVKSY